MLNHSRDQNATRVAWWGGGAGGGRAWYVAPDLSYDYVGKEEKVGRILMNETTLKQNAKKGAKKWYTSTRYSFASHVCIQSGNKNGESDRVNRLQIGHIIYSQYGSSYRSFRAGLFLICMIYMICMV